LHHPKDSEPAQSQCHAFLGLIYFFVDHTQIRSYIKNIPLLYKKQDLDITFTAANVAICGRSLMATFMRFFA
tara:strand:+ start:2428 stop:2643 length:216 start_codon:yes stop_codon:yes gene_type:complete